MIRAGRAQASLNVGMLLASEGATFAANSILKSWADMQEEEEKEETERRKDSAGATGAVLNPERGQEI